VLGNDIHFDGRDGRGDRQQIDGMLRTGARTTQRGNRTVAAAVAGNVAVNGAVAIVLGDDRWHEISKRHARNGRHSIGGGCGRDVRRTGRLERRQSGSGLGDSVWGCFLWHVHLCTLILVVLQRQLLPLLIVPVCFAVVVI
jgi:hypothetical protein